MLTTATGALALFPHDSENSTDLVAVVAFFLVALVFILRSMRDEESDRRLGNEPDEGGDFL